MDEPRRQQRTGESAKEALPPSSPRPTYWEMLEKLTPKATRPDPDGEEVVQTVGNPQAQPVAGEPQSSAARDRQRALTAHLMEQVCEPQKQCKRTKTIADLLRQLGVPQWRAWITALSGKGWWRLAGSPSTQEGLSDAWLESLGLLSLRMRYEQLNR